MCLALTISMVERGFNNPIFPSKRIFPVASRETPPAPFTSFEKDISAIFARELLLLALKRGFHSKVKTYLLLLRLKQSAKKI